MLDQCPRVREDVDGYQDDDGCPDPDNDGDGLPDLTDECPDETGSRERQGCPNMDHDGDGVADANDRCPAQKENHNDYLDQDGCPDSPPTRVTVTQQRIEPKERIVFGSGSDQITAGRAVLDDVYKVLTDAPDMKLRIEGHTDAEGSEANNLALSKRRAKAILNYLVRKGINAGRLHADGFGETRPIDTNRTTRGRQKNRRVEFIVESKGSGG
ncbi:MAG: outer membrane protein OmpA-like peptidoglycan-associated protein [Kiritimatiellia bacterium]|jgi:outer membrane protein OmpA-like peptidoglycan-associated protein